ncbi:protein-tyrosine phosphatase family protein [Endozoicomonadaceae bacterium StTr2]
MLDKLSKLKPGAEGERELATLASRLSDKVAADSQIKPSTRQSLQTLLLNTQATKKVETLVLEARQNGDLPDQLVARTTALVNEHAFSELGARIAERVAEAIQAYEVYFHTHNILDGAPPVPPQPEVIELVEDFADLTELEPELQAVIGGLLQKPADFTPLWEQLSQFGNRDQQQTKDLLEDLNNNHEAFQIPEAEFEAAKEIIFEKLAHQKVGDLLERHPPSTRSGQEFKREVAELKQRYQGKKIGVHFNKELNKRLNAGAAPKPPKSPKPSNIRSETPRSPTPPRRQQSQERPPSPLPPRRQQSQERSPSPLPPRRQQSQGRTPNTPPPIPQRPPETLRPAAFRLIEAAHQQLGTELTEPRTTPIPPDVIRSFNKIPKPVPEGDLMKDPRSGVKAHSRYANIASPKDTHAGNLGNNANYVMNRNYILAQAPSLQYKSANSHLAMIMRNNSAVSVDFTNNDDLTKQKTIKYVPEPGEPPIKFAGDPARGEKDIVVETKSAQELPGDVKIYHITLNGKPVVHVKAPIQDKTAGNPASLVQTALINAIVTKQAGEQAGPPVLHCSAGVGRSGLGTLMTYMVEQYIETGTKPTREELLDVIHLMRTERDPQVIQVVGQLDTAFNALDNLEILVEALFPGIQQTINAQQ